MQCGTNDMQYLITITAKVNVTPTASGNTWQIYVNSIKNPVENSTGFYYYWGLQAAFFTVLKCDSACATCTGPTANECLTCSDSNKQMVDGQCLCKTGSNKFYNFGAAISVACRTGCPDCTYTDGSDSTNCYYRDYVRRMCVNPPTNNCSAPYSFG